MKEVSSGQSSTFALKENLLPKHPDEPDYPLSNMARRALSSSQSGNKETEEDEPVEDWALWEREESSTSDSTADSTTDSGRTNDFDVINDARRIITSVQTVNAKTKAELGRRLDERLKSGGAPSNTVGTRRRLLLEQCVEGSFLQQVLLEVLPTDNAGNQTQGRIVVTDAGIQENSDMIDAIIERGEPFWVRAQQVLKNDPPNDWSERSECGTKQFEEYKLRGMAYEGIRRRLQDRQKQNNTKKTKGKAYTDLRLEKILHNGAGIYIRD